jgi:hypothetical protein
MQQVLHHSSLVPCGFVVESACFEGDSRYCGPGRREALVYAHRAEQFPDAFTAVIGDVWPICLSQGGL